MSGTFLNFFECKLSNNIVEAYTTDYKSIIKQYNVK